MKDYLLYIGLRVVIFFLRFLPLKAWLFVARRVGWVYYYFAGKKNRKAFANLKLAFGNKSRPEVKRILRQMYQQFAQNFIEALYLPYLNRRSIEKYVALSGSQYVREALAGKHGIIFLGCHAGSWEISNVASALFFGSVSGQREVRYAMLAQPQSRYQRLDAFLNAMRQAKGCDVIKVTELKKMVEHLSANHMLGVVADHGGREGLPIEFFGKLAMTPIGSVKLAKKLGSKIILAFMHRVGGPYHEMIFKPYELEGTGDPAQDLKVNLERINKVFEAWITEYPQEYLWFYKRWKQSPQKNILILSDAKAGHEKQSLALVEMISSFGFKVVKDVVEVSFKSRARSTLLSLAVLLFGPAFGRASLRFFLQEKTYSQIMPGAYDLVISTGSSLAALNLCMAYENNARSIAIMRPGISSFDRFDLVIMPQHDHPPQLKNVLVSTGSLNAVTQESMERDFSNLSSVKIGLKELRSDATPKIGLLLGGDSKNYRLSPESIDFLCGQLKRILEESQASLVLSTSRRTPSGVVEILKKNFAQYGRCKLFVVASEENPSGTVGAIFYLSDIVIVSGESISMVSEAVASGKQVIVFEPHCLVPDNKVGEFLKSLSEKKYIYLLKLSEIYDKISWLVREKPGRSSFEGRQQILEGLRKII